MDSVAEKLCNMALRQENVTTENTLTILHNFVAYICRLLKFP